MRVIKEIDVTAAPTPEQIAMLKAAASRPPEPDDEFPELTLEQLKKLRDVADERRTQRQKQSVTIRLPPRTIAKAKALGKGYTSVMSRIIERVMDDPELVREYL